MSSVVDLAVWLVSFVSITPWLFGATLGSTILQEVEYAIFGFFGFLEYLVTQGLLDCIGWMAAAWLPFWQWLSGQIPYLSYLTAFFSGIVVPIVVIIDWVLNVLTGGNASVIWDALFLRYGVYFWVMGVDLARWVKKTVLA